MKKFKVDLYFTTFCSIEIKAENEQDAILRAREDLEFTDKVNTELAQNCDSWKSGDTAEEIRDKVRCNNCWNIYYDEAKREKTKGYLLLMRDTENKIIDFKACPECKTDGYLTDDVSEGNDTTLCKRA